MRSAAFVWLTALTCLAYCGCIDTMDDYTPAVEITTGAILDAAAGEPYFCHLRVRGGVGTNYYWTLVDGELPAGISLLPSGAISGTPILTGRCTFTVKAQELTATFVSDSATRELTLTVKAWQRPAVITASGTDSRNPAIAVDSNRVVHGAWEEGVPGSTEIYYSADLGTVAASPENVSNTAGDSAHPSLTVDGADNLHLVWSEYAGTTYQIMYASCDGTSWTSAIDVSATTADSTGPVVAVDSGDSVHVVWVESSAGGDEIMWSFSDAATPSSPATISGSVTGCGAPAVWAGSAVHVVFSGDTGTSSEIYLTSYSGGAWSAPVNLSDDDIESVEPTIGGSGDVFVAWSSGAALSQWIAYRTLSGREWSDVGFAQPTGGYAGRPRAVVDGEGRATIVWADGSATTSLFAMQVAGSEQSSPVSVTSGSVNAVEPDLAVDSTGRIYGLYAFEGSPDYQIGHTEFAQRVWHEPVEMPVSATGPGDVRMALDSQGTLHSVWRQDDTPTLRNIYYSSLESGYSWVTPTFLSVSNTGRAHLPKLAVDLDDNLHAVWQGPGTGGVSQVWYSQREGETWLAPVEVTSDPTDNSELAHVAVSSPGQIHIVFTKALSAYGGAREIYHTYSYDGITWFAISSVSESTDGDSWGASIAIDEGDALHVTWSEDDDIVYRSFDWPFWSIAENLSNSTGQACQPSIALGEDGSMLIAYQDDTSGTFYPMYSHYDGTAWSAAANIVDSVPAAADYLNVAHHDGTFHAVWGQSLGAGQREIWFASFDGSSWTTPVKLSTEDGDNRPGTMGGAVIVDEGGTIHIAFTNTTTGKNYYTRK